MIPVLGLAVLFLLAPLALAAQPTSGSSREATRAEITALYERMLSLVRARDTAALKRLMVSDYMFTVSGSDVVLNRSERLAGIAADPDSIAMLFLDRCNINVFGTAAISACRVKERTVTSGRLLDRTIRTTITWVRGADRQWRTAATHASDVKPDQP